MIMEIRPISNFSAPPSAATEKPSVAVTPIAAPPSVPISSEALQPVNGVQLAQAVGHLNQTMKTRDSGLEFSVDEESHRTVVKVVDQQTKELIRQMPSAEALEISKALERVQGMLINQKA
jgi:flagellar protein FlaG